VVSAVSHGSVWCEIARLVKMTRTPMVVLCEDALVSLQVLMVGHGGARCCHGCH